MEFRRLDGSGAVSIASQPADLPVIWNSAGWMVLELSPWPLNRRIFLKYWNLTVGWFWRWLHDHLTVRSTQDTKLKDSIPIPCDAAALGCRRSVIIYFSEDFGRLPLLTETATCWRCQMSLTYSWMVRSEENLPTLAVLSMAILAQRFWSP